MNLKTLAASTLLAATSLFSAVPAEAGQGWIHSSTSVAGVSFWIKPYGCNSGICSGDVMTSGSTLIVETEYNCNQKIQRAKANDIPWSSWVPVLPGTVQLATLKIACQYS